MDFSGGGHENVDISEDDTGGVSKFDPGDKLVVLGNSMDVLLPMNWKHLTNVGALVADMVDEYMSWRWGLFGGLLPYEILLKIAAVKVSSQTHLPEFPRWILSSNGIFQLQSAYRVRVGVQLGPMEPIWTVIARFKGMSQVKSFIWLAFLEKLMTNEVRFRRQFTTDC
ncbi:hypothetical protein V6N12_049781 [Hibiscus sabdariffa]|uniref:Reverse transcriptase zinc-binding domain-containing protein n=1 Tax=Hibiscus sabdariffa TaxID=183260 RepID=A0ABR2GC83_9ROSI